MSNVFIVGYAGWFAYDTFLIVSHSGWPVYHPNSLRHSPNPQKPMSSSCHVRGLGQTLTPLGKVIRIECNYNKYNYFLVKVSN